MHERFEQAHGELSGSDGDDDEDDDLHGNSNRRSTPPHQRPPNPPPPHNNGGGGSGDGGGGGGDDGGGGGTPSDPERRTLSESHSNRLNPQGHTMPCTSTMRYSTPGILEAAENHRAVMHERLLSLIQQHLAVHLQIPHGMKVRKTDSESIGTFSGSARFGDLESWLMDLVIMFKAEQYGGTDRDCECCLQLLSFLSGEAKKWYHRHTVSIN
jgi:hypothetical protein